LPKFNVSRPAQFDIREIARFTLERWGVSQAHRYTQGLRATFQLLADNPRMGRSCDAISAGLHRHEVGKHVIFYRLKPSGIRVVRILHQQMNPSKSYFKTS
jgi:toxin ParE1/3/4